MSVKAKKAKSPLGRDPLTEKRSSLELRLTGKDRRIQRDDDDAVNEEVFLIMPKRSRSIFPLTNKAVWNRMFSDHASAKSFLETYRKLDPVVSKPFRIYRATIRVTDQYGD